VGGRGERIGVRGNVSAYRRWVCRRSELEPRADILARRVRAGKPECDLVRFVASAGRWEYLENSLAAGG
jgi:hypothetical protein